MRDRSVTEGGHLGGLLEGVRVIEVALLAPDALGMHLADLGAEVIKVEEPGLGDYVREVGRAPGEEVSPLHCQWNRGKRSVALDLRTPAGVEVFKALVAHADVVIEGLRAGALARRGLGPEELLAIRPDLVFASLSGFGQDGPYRDLPSHGVGFDAYAGLADPAEGPEGWPCMPGGYTQVGILAGPLYAAMAVLAGIVRARATGRGCVLDVAEADCAADWLALPLMRQVGRCAGREGAAELERPSIDSFAENVRYQYYAAADGRHVMIMASERKFWENFGRATGRPDLPERYPSKEVGDHMVGNRELRRELVELFATRTQAEWVRLGLDADVPIVPVNVGHEVLDDPHFRARSRWSAGHALPMLATPVRADVPLPDPTPAPDVGQHTEEVLRQVLHYDDPRIERLRRAGAFGPRDGHTHPSPGDNRLPAG